MNPELKRAAELAAEYIESIDHQNVSEEPDPQVLREKLQKELTDDGLPPLQVIDELARDARDGLLNSASGRFFGWVIGGATVGVTSRRCAMACASASRPSARGKSVESAVVIAANTSSKHL